MYSLLCTRLGKTTVARDSEELWVCSGTNAIPAFGMQVVHSNGEVVYPSLEEREQVVNSSKEFFQPITEDVKKTEHAVRVVLSQMVHLGPQQTREVKVEVAQPSMIDSASETLGIIVPVEQHLAQ